MSFTKPLESSTRKKIDTILEGLDWKTNEETIECNVFTERAKTKEQNNKLQGNFPDYVLYQSNSDNPIAIIEAKRKGQSLEKALQQAIDKYAKPLDVLIIFVYDSTFIKTWDLRNDKELTIDENVLTQLISEEKLLRFIETGSNIEEITPEVKHTREELIRVFKWANDLLRKEGLRNLDRFVEFSNLLFIKIISEIEDDREKKGLSRRLPKDICWESFSKEKDQKKMLNYINDTVLEKGFAKEYNHTDDIFQMKLKIQNPKTVKQIVEKLSTLTLINTESEIKGDAFEYFLKSLAPGNDLGEYFTPRHIVKFMVSLINPKYGNTILDPFCGTGGFLIEAFRYIKTTIDENDETIMKNLKETSVFGIELTDTYKIAKMNMIITGDGHNNIVQDDTAKNTYWDKILSSYKEKGILDKLYTIKENGFDVIFSNIPYGQTTNYGNTYPIPSIQGDSIFIQFIIKSLADGGKCAVIVPEGLLFKSEHKSLRKHLIDTCDLQAVISLPSGVFYPYAGVKTNILVFKKGERTNKTWFYKVEHDGFELSAKRKRISDNDLPDALEKFSERVTSENSLTVLRKDIEHKEYRLNYTSYIEIDTGEIAFKPLEDILNEIKTIEVEINKELQILSGLIV